MADITEQIVREAPDIEAYKLGLMKSAQALTPPQLPAYQVAGMSPQQQAAIEAGQQGIGAYAPYLQSGTQTQNTAANTLGQAAGTLSGIDLGGQYNTATQAQNAALAKTLQTSQPLGEAQISQYMNPYANQVLNNQLQEMGRQAQIQQQGLNAQAVRSGAFGGSRQGIQQQELNRNLMQTQNQAIAQSLAQNYAQGLNTAQQQQQMGLQSAQQLGNLGAGIGALTNQQLSGMGSLGTQLGNLGVQQAALGQSAQQLGQQDVNFLYNIGAQQQKQSQAELDALRATQMQNAMQPYQQLAFQSDIYKGAPSSQMAVTSQQTPAPSPFQQVAGLGTGILGTAAAVNAASKLF